MRFSGLAWVAVFLLAFGTAGARAQTTTRVSVDSNGVQANGSSNSLGPSISGDGRYIAFGSYAANLVSGDTNGCNDVFVHDRQLGTTDLVSVDSNGVQGNGDSGFFGISISADGRNVAFGSMAWNLVSGNPGVGNQVFVHDRQLGTTECVSVNSNGAEGNGFAADQAPSISADGRYVAFASNANNLVAGDTNGLEDVFVHDRQLGTTELVSVDSNGIQGNGHSGDWGVSISANGRYVAFKSGASNLVSGDTNVANDVFVHDRQLGTTERVSVDSSGAQGNGDSTWVSISGDGRYVAFGSWATNLVAGDIGGNFDIFVHDRQLGTTELVSVDSSGIQGNGQSDFPSISADGRYAAFHSWATNFVSGDMNGLEDIFVHDRLTGTTQCGSVDSSGVPGNGGSFIPSISADGRYVAFGSSSSDLVSGDTNGATDVFVRDRGIPPPETYCTAKVNSLGCPPSIGYSGTPTLSGPDNFFVTATNVLSNKTGILFWGGGSANIPFHGGIRCVASPFIRTHGMNSGGNPPPSDCSGSYSFHFSQSYMAAHLLGAGETLYAQFWSRDPGFPVPDNIGLTDGLQFTIGP